MICGLVWYFVQEINQTAFCSEQAGTIFPVVIVGEAQTDKSLHGGLMLGMK